MIDNFHFPTHEDPSHILYGIFLTLIYDCFLGYLLTEDCHEYAGTFISVGGGIILGTSVLVVVLDVAAYVIKDNGCKEKCCGIWLIKLSNLATALGYFAHFVVMIWGSVVIFGK